MVDYLPVAFSSASGDWRTPTEIRTLVGAVFRDLALQRSRAAWESFIRESDPRIHRNHPIVELDPCASTDPSRHFARHNICLPDNGLTASWRANSVYMNPPYGRQIQTWVQKFMNEYRRDSFIEGIMLVPARTDTKWWALMDSLLICFVRGRLTFEDAPYPAPFPSALAYAGSQPERFVKMMAPIGSLWRKVG